MSSKVTALSTRWRLLLSALSLTEQRIFPEVTVAAALRIYHTPKWWPFRVFQPTCVTCHKSIVFHPGLSTCIFPKLLHSINSYSEPNVELSCFVFFFVLLHLTWQLQQSWKHMYRSVVFVLQKSEYNWEKCGLTLLTWVWFLGSSSSCFCDVCHPHRQGDCLLFTLTC